jgi:hypothetical protein
MKHLLLFLSIGSLFFMAVDPAHAGGRRGGLQAAPRLMEPSEEADLTQNEELLFRWQGDADRSLIREYQFKLYKGTETVEAGLIRAVTVPAGKDRLGLPAGLFENGQTYAWQLRGSGSAKTRTAYSIFRVKK